jgi:hypothetical protein
MKLTKSRSHHSKPGHQELIIRQQRVTAHHEAGHAFAGWHFGFKVKKATIVPKDDSAGYVVTRTGLLKSSLNQRHHHRCHLQIRQIYRSPRANARLRKRLPLPVLSLNAWICIVINVRCVFG